MTRAYFEPFIPRIPKKRGRKPQGERPLTPKEYRKKYNQKKRARKIAVLDMETDPFDNQSQSRIDPFAACLYSDHFEPVIIWEENRERFARAVVAAIEKLSDRYIVYAHNGGRFDFMFLVHLLRGEVSFKGRGIMSATIGAHELRDSFHIIPEKLAAYQKDSFDYEKLKRAKRRQHREEILKYMVADCCYLLELVKGFHDEFGLKLSIGQAAMYELKQHYEVKKLSEGWDEYLRSFFYGGRVECLTGRTMVTGDYKLYDVNSMYPHVMASYQHPIGDFFDYDLRIGDPDARTCFIDLECRNQGALVGKTAAGETTTRITSGRFFTTVHEYQVAKKYGLISDVRINFCVDCSLQTDFAAFVEPLYKRRQGTKALLGNLKRNGLENSEQYLSVKRDDLFLKLLMNNAYGKFAQNPRRFKEYYITDPDDMPPREWFRSICHKTTKDEWRKIGKRWVKLVKAENEIYLLPESENEGYWVWAKPAPGFRFNNVGTAASITGAARAVLLEALQHAVESIYCDTDSIICRELPGVRIDKEALGAWDLEDEFSKVIIDGKKLYSCWYKKPKLGPGGQIVEYKIRSKGTSGLKWADMVDLFNGAEKALTNSGPTLTRTGAQYYLTRRITATAQIEKGIQ